MNFFRGMVITFCITMAVVCCCLFAMSVNGPHANAEPCVECWFYFCGMFGFAGAFIWIASRPWPIGENDDDNPFGEYEKCGHPSCTICNSDEN